MAGTSWEHQREVRDARQTIVSDPQLGVAALSSAQIMSNLPLGMRGVTHAVGCRTHQAPVGLPAYQFSTAADYRSGLSHLNDLTGWNPSGAGTGCPPQAGSNSAQTGWHSNVNPKYAARQGQILECYPDSHNTGILIYLWTLPTQRVILVGSEGPTGATFSSLENWWAGLSYG